jgi:two-component system, OmpR family, sensor histidine kinase KdpD
MSGQRQQPPAAWLGILSAALLIAVVTLIVLPLRNHAPAAALGVAYLLVVLVISVAWRAWLGVVTALACAVAFNFFHLPPTGSFTIKDSGNVTALVAFLVVAFAVIAVAQLAQRRALEAERRRAEADLAAQAARVLLGEGDLHEGLALVAERLAGALGLPSAAVVVGPEPEVDPRRATFALGDAGWLVVPAQLPKGLAAELSERIAPALAPVLAAALERARLQGEVVETAALRQSDVAKTAVLRAVSHDLRSPLTAIVTAGEALRSPTLHEDERDELADVVVSEGSRLSRLIEKLLDLSRLQSGTGRQRVEPISLEEVLHAAADEVGGDFELSLGELPPLRADAAQLERAFANLLENAARYSAGEPVKVRARALHNRVVVRVVDRGPGIPRAQQERIFEPFHRGTDQAHTGAGLGLAIVRGLVEANGGRVSVESLPGQGASFIVELPLEPAEPDAPAAASGSAAAAATGAAPLSGGAAAAAAVAASSPAAAGRAGSGRA